MLGPDLSFINFDEFTYFLRASDKTMNSWDDVPDKIKETFERIGIPEAERKTLNEGVEKAEKALEEILKNGIEKAMNLYN